MSEKTLKTIIALRRDTEANYAKYPYIPKKGEVAFVDTANKGLRAKVGDGTTTFANLPYQDEELREEIEHIVDRGYFLNGKFFTDSTYTVEMVKSVNRLYIDNNSKVIYTYDSGVFTSVNDTLPTASENQAGIAKLYKTKGTAEDGSMTQKAISENLNTKFEVSVDEDSESAVFTITL